MHVGSGSDGLDFTSYVYISVKKFRKFIAWCLSHGIWGYITPTSSDATSCCCMTTDLLGVHVIECFYWIIRTHHNKVMLEATHCMRGTHRCASIELLSNVQFDMVLFNYSLQTLFCQKHLHLQTRLFGRTCLYYKNLSDSSHLVLPVCLVISRETWVVNGCRCSKSSWTWYKIVFCCGHMWDCHCQFYAKVMYFPPYTKWIIRSQTGRSHNNEWFSPY